MGVTHLTPTACLQSTRAHRRSQSLSLGKLPRHALMAPRTAPSSRSVESTTTTMAITAPRGVRHCPLRGRQLQRHRQRRRLVLVLRLRFRIRQRRQSQCQVQRPRRRSTNLVPWLQGLTLDRRSIHSLPKCPLRYRDRRLFRLRLALRLVILGRKSFSGLR